MLLLRYLVIILAAALVSSCASKEKLAQRDREDAQRDLEYARERGRRDAEEFNGFLIGYAQVMGIKPGQLPPNERAEAYRIYRRN